MEAEASAPWGVIGAFGLEKKFKFRHYVMLISFLITTRLTALRMVFNLEEHFRRRPSSAF